VIERVPQIMADDGQEFFPGRKSGFRFPVSRFFLREQIGGGPGGRLIMSPPLFRSHIRSDPLGVDGFIGSFSLDPESFISFGLALFAAPAPIRSPQVTRSV
jgi:hypothetical protein